MEDSTSTLLPPSHSFAGYELPSPSILSAPPGGHHYGQPGPAQQDPQSFLSQSLLLGGASVAPSDSGYLSSQSQGFSSSALSSRQGAPAPGLPQRSDAPRTGTGRGGQPLQGQVRELLAEVRSLGARIDRSCNGASSLLEFRSLGNQVWDMSRFIR